MPDDILDAAQKVVDDAAKTADAGVSPQAPSVSSPPTDLPSEPAPEPPVNTEVSTPPPSSPTPTAPEPQPQGPPKPPSEEATKLVESLLEPKQPEPSVIAPPPKKPTPPPAKKSSGKGVVLALLAVLLIALPVGVYFISQQNQELADVRSEASGSSPYGNNQPCGANGYCANGYTCQGGICKPNTNTDCKQGDSGAPVCCNRDCPKANQVCEPPNRLECNIGGVHCTIKGKGCGGGGGDDDDDDNVNPPKCQLIKIYKGNQEVTPSTLKPGDNVKLAVKGNRVGQKGRFRVNGKALDGTGNWTETTTKNARNEWTVNYTIPPGVTDFVIEGEVFMGGAWR